MEEKGKWKEEGEEKGKRGRKREREKGETI